MSTPGTNSSNNCDGYNTDVMIESDDEHDLTSLTWLMELRNQSFSWPNVMQLVTSDDDVITNYTANANKQQKSNNRSIMEQKNSFTNIYNNIGKTFANNGYMVKSSCNKIITHECDKQQNVGSNNDERTSKISKRSWIGNNKYIEESFKKPTINLKTNQQKLQMKRATPTERFEMFLEKIKRVLAEYEKSALNYQTDTTVKPPFNYSHIIGMVMLENGRVTLQQICSWIEKKFAFFRVRKKWNNSIRHNLSLHQCFLKIDRKKFEKGKGGYWELGIDPRKCDRKRIRNRKGAQCRNKHLQQQQQQQQEQKTTTSTFSAYATTNKQTKNPKIFTPLDEVSRLPNENYYHIESSTSNNMQSDHPDVIITLTESADQQTEKHLLLDELDIQQNIDVVSYCQQTQVQPNQNVNVFSKSESRQQTIQSLKNNKQQQQQYQLDTIIISTAATKNGDISNFAATAESMNCFINDEYTNEKAAGLQKDFVYINKEIPSTCESIIVSSYMDENGVTPDKFIKVQTNCKSRIYRSNRVMNFNSNFITNNALSPSVSCPSMAAPTETKKILVPQSLRPNVFVDHIVQPSSSECTAGAPLLKAKDTALLTQVATDAHNDNNLHAQPHNHQIMTIDNIRPYIDGIEEAFQYLRSIDYNREDLLDNFLDISVNDY